MKITMSNRDFVQKYGECIVKLTVKATGTTYLYMISSISHNTLTGYVLRPNKEWSGKDYPVADIDIDFSIPDVGMVNTQGSVMYVRRRACKQYRQAFTYRNNVIVGEYVEQALVDSDGDLHRVDRPSVTYDIFYPTYYPIELALPKVVEGRSISVAITSRYYISVSAYLPFIYLGFMGKPVAKVTATGECYLFRETMPLLEDLSNYVNIVGEYNDI